VTLQQKELLFWLAVSDNYLPSKVQGSTRNSLIRSFRNEKEQLMCLRQLIKLSNGLLKIPLTLSVVTQIVPGNERKYKNNKVIKDDSEKVQTYFVPAKGRCLLIET